MDNRTIYRTDSSNSLFISMKYFHFTENFGLLIFNHFFSLLNYTQNREKLPVKFTVTLEETT